MTGALAPAAAFAAAAVGIWGLADLRPFPRPAGLSRRGGVRLGAVVRLLVAAGRLLRPAARARAPRDLAGRIAAAGRPGGLGPRDVMGAKLGAAVLAAPVGVLGGAVLPGRLGLLTTLVLPVAGFLAPDVWLGRRAAARFREVRRVLPAHLDLLGVTIEAGLALPAAMAAVGARTGGPLGAEWRALAREAELGVPLTVALAGLCDRLPLPEVQALAAAVARAALHGAPLAGTLAAQARHARAARRQAIREEAAKAGPKIQLVVALLLVPSVLLLVAAALIAALVDRGSVSLV